MLGCFVQDEIQNITCRQAFLRHFLNPLVPDWLARMIGKLLAVPLGVGNALQANLLID